MANSSTAAVDFLLVAPLAEERAALLSHLPGAQRLPPDDKDVRVYYQADVPTELPGGERGTYRAVITSLLNMGRVEAATATADAIRRWQPRYVMLVGIAGGDPDAVELGDVLIADQFIDYEQQKLTDAGAQVRYQSYRSDGRLFGAAQHMVAWEAAVKVPRPAAGSPRCHFGVMVSGDKVQAKKGALKAYKSDWPELIGVEMEAGGVAAAAWQSPSRPGILMIRGVSDQADARKSSARVKPWRPYACDVAAVYAVALLRSGPVPLTPTRAVAPSAGPGEARSPRSDSSSAQPRPSKESLRRLLKELLRLDSAFNAFCLDFFPDTEQAFSNGMDAEQKRNLLLKREEAAEILASLKKADPAAYAKHAHLVELES